MQSANTQRVGRFTIHYLQLIDNGAFSQVVRARSTGGREYAVKIINKQTIIKYPAAIKQVLRQMDIVKQVKSQLIVNVTDSICDDLNYYFFMEYCKQGNLYKYLIGRKQMGEMQIIALMKHIMESYSQLYKRNIIHRDLKPGNILLRNGIPIISDFGTAKFVNLNKEIELLTNFTGTRGYMAPEMCKLNPMDKNYYDHGVDIWSLGIIFYQMIEGNVPWTISNNNIQRTIETIQSKPLKLKRLISYESKRVIRSCLELRPEDRIRFEQLVKHDIFNMNRQKFEYYEKQAKQLKESVKLSPGNEEIQKYLSQRLYRNQYSISVCQISQFIMNKLDWEQNQCHQIFHQYRDYEDRINVKTVQKMLGFEEAKIQLRNFAEVEKKPFYMNNSTS